jgi:hypothetical protein
MIRSRFVSLFMELNMVLFAVFLLQPGKPPGLEWTSFTSPMAGSKSAGVNGTF